MATTSKSATAAADTAPVLLALVYRRGLIDWLEWLPVARLASSDPSLLVAAFGTLSVTAQIDLVEKMRSPEAGALALAVVVALATRAGQIVDEQVRQYILGDAVEAWRNTDRLVQTIRHNLEPLADAVEGMRGRVDAAFDLAAEQLRLEHALSELRLAEAGTEQRFDAIHAIEQEILVLQTRSRVLGAYDEDARALLRDGLSTEVESLDARKRALETQVGALAVDRDRMRQEVAEREADVRRSTLESEELSRRRAAAQADVKRLTAVTAEAERERATLAAEVERVSADATRLDAVRKQSGERLRAERKRLADLEAAAKQAGLADIERKVQEIYGMLPPDQVEAKF